MSNTRQTFSKQRRYAALFSILILGIVTIIGSGGSDSSGVVPADPTGKPDLLPLYDLVITGVGDGITAEVNEGETTHTIRINPILAEGAGLAATLHCVVETEECEIGSIKTDTTIEVYDVSETLFGDFTIQVMETLTLSGSENPTTGLIQVTSGADIIKLNITACDTAPGVEIRLNDTVQGCYPWTDFENLDEKPAATTAEQIAVFAFDMIDFIFYQANFANNSFDLIDDSISDAGGSVDLMCSAFSSRGYAVQTGIADQGIYSFSWVDDNQDNVVGSGDSFRLNFTDCWFGDIDDIDIFNGSIDLNAYTAVTNSEDVVTRFGFEGATAGKTGGVFYNSFVMTEALVNTGSIFFADSTISLSGGFTIVYSEPVQ